MIIHESIYESTNLNSFKNKDIFSRMRSYSIIAVCDKRVTQRKKNNTYYQAPWDGIIEVTLHLSLIIIKY